MECSRLPKVRCGCFRRVSTLWRKRVLKGWERVLEGWERVLERRERVLERWLVASWKRWLLVAAGIEGLWEGRIGGGWSGGGSEG